MPQAPLKKKQTAKPQRNRLAGITKSQGGGLKKGAKVIAPKNVARLKVHKFSKVGFPFLLFCSVVWPGERCRACMYGSLVLTGEVENYGRDDGADGEGVGGEGGPFGAFGGWEEG